MAIRRHPDISTLMTCAAGSQPEVLCAVIASHISMCPACLRKLRQLEQIGLGMFIGLERSPVPVAVLDPPRPAMAGAGVRMTGTSCADVPERDVPTTLVDVLGPHLDALEWCDTGPGVSEVVVPLSDGAAGDLRLSQLAPGAELAWQSQTGEQLTLVLRGRYGDEQGWYEVGDIADLDDQTAHQVTADPSLGCIILVARECARPASVRAGADRQTAHPAWKSTGSGGLT